jgi:hypothetical protein
MADNPIVGVVVDDDPPLLTVDEHRAVALLGEIADLLSRRVVGHGETRVPDLTELFAHIHAVQAAVLAQAATRAYPDLYRALGETLGGES